MKAPTRLKGLTNKTMGLLILVVIIHFSSSLVCQDLIITRIADKDGQYSDIHYSNIEVNQNIDFTNLIRVYINKSSTIMIDTSIAKLKDVGEIVFDKLKTGIEKKYGELDEKSIVNATSDLKILIRKSVFTSKDNYKTLMDMVNEAIWRLQQDLSTNVYHQDYPSLTAAQK